MKSTSPSIEKRTLLFALMGLLVWSSVTTLASIYYYSQYTEARRTFEQLQSLGIRTNVLIDYGNGTQNWHNKTVIAGSTAYDALLAATRRVEYTPYSWGKYVTSIDGVREVLGAQAWFWYRWNATSSKWDSATVGVDAYILKHDDSTAWRYESY